MKTLLPIIGILWMQSAFAVLSPFYESVSEIKEMLADPNFAQAFDTAEAIQHIETIDSGFIVQTQSKELKVDVIYKPLSHPGRQQFEFRYNRPIPIANKN